MELPSEEDRSTRVLLQSLRAMHAAGPRSEPLATMKASALLNDPDVRDIVSLRSRDRQRVIDVLSRDEDLTAPLVPHVIRLLAWEPVADHAMFALQRVAEERIGQLIDALIDPNQDFDVRRRLARVFSVCVSQRAADGLMLALDDPRFDVRSQSARSLTSILEKNGQIHISSERVFAIVMREVTVGRPVWESRRLLDVAGEDTPVDAFVRARAGASLAHVFTLLSLVLPKEPLQIALRSLQTDDEQLQGTALEYLESVLPVQIRFRLWPFLERKPVTSSTRPRSEIIADLLRSHVSIMLNLDELRRAQVGRT
jgi:ATP:ADP antiporter, AAA family